MARDCIILKVGEKQMCDDMHDDDIYRHALRCAE